MAEESTIIFEPKPDPLEQKVRFGCGSVLGLVLGLSLAVRWWPSTAGTLLLVVIGALLCGWMALKYGDGFWTNYVTRWLRWW